MIFFPLRARLAILLIAFAPSLVSAEFEWIESEDGTHLDLKYKTRYLARYVYEPIDETSKERREETYKPFCHIYKWWSKENFITKGPGGKYTHHRGIFYGFNNISYTDRDGERQEHVDVWHCRDAHQIHREFIDREIREDSATFTSRIDWIGSDGNDFAQEERTMKFSMSGSDIVVDFISRLTPTVPLMRLDGDPQHAGFHFRANNEVHEKSQNATYYIRPESGKGAPGVTTNWSKKNDDATTRNLPWKAMSFALEGKQYTVVYLVDPENPEPNRFSEREYARFGSYFATDITPEEPLTVSYRLVIHYGEMEVEEVVDLYQEYVRVGGE